MTINLNGSWKFRNTNDNEYMDASVPGSVYADLFALGKIPDPYYRDNEDEVRRLSDFDYEYTRLFVADDLCYKNIELVCDGIDTLCEIYINDVFVAKTKNMHRGYRFDVKDIIKQGENTIKVVLLSPTKYIEKMHSIEPLGGTHDAVEGFSHLRKAHCMFGWDWGPTLPDLGIWRDIRIECYNERIKDFYITQTHSENRVDLAIDVDATSDSISVEITSPDGKKYTAQGADCKITVEDPMLWWHQGYGKQNLYDVKISLGTEDVREFKIGLRTLTVNTEKDEWGRKFCFNVNGKNIFAMGSNYIPEDSILARTSEERTRKLLTDCVKANHNCIRIWGGGTYLPDYFYSICDELGLIVWQDFMFACGVYSFDELEEEVKEEVIYNVKRLRHHSCIGLWCGNNEIEEAWAVMWSQIYSEKYKADYIKLFECIIPKLVSEYDPNRLYWSSSPSSGGSFIEPRNENVGDRHYWSVWHGMEPFEDYKNYHFRFLSEFGFQSFPCVKTIETFALPEDMNIFSYVMEKHQKNGTANERIVTYLSRNYSYPYSFEHLVYLSQLLQAESMRFGVEHFRRNRKNDRCMGTLYWQTNDCWPVASWSGIDYYGRWKALHYKSKRFYAPVLLSADIEDTCAKLCVVNDSNSAFCGKAEWRLADSDGKTIRKGVCDVNAESLDVAEVAELDFSDCMSCYKDKTNLVFNYRLFDAESEISSECQLFVKPKHFEYKNPGINIEYKEDRVEISVSAFAHEIELTAEDADMKFSDNYFSLLPGETKTIYTSSKPMHITTRTVLE